MRFSGTYHGHGASVVFDHDFRAFTHAVKHRREVARCFRVRDVDHVLIHCTSSALEGLWNASDAARGASDNQGVIQRCCLMDCENRMAAHATKGEQIVEWNTNDPYPSTAHITAWGDVSLAHPARERRADVPEPRNQVHWCTFQRVGTTT